MAFCTRCGSGLLADARVLRIVRHRRRRIRDGAGVAGGKRHHAPDELVTGRRAAAARAAASAGFGLGHRCAAIVRATRLVSARERTGRAAGQPRARGVVAGRCSDAPRCCS